MTITVYWELNARKECLEVMVYVEIVQGPAKLVTGQQVVIVPSAMLLKAIGGVKKTQEFAVKSTVHPELTSILIS